MKVYAVFKEGAYRHECGGIFSTQEAAERAASELINGEKDDHHDYKVFDFKLDAITPQDPDNGWVNERPAICRFIRCKGVVTRQKVRKKRGHDIMFLSIDDLK